MGNGGIIPCILNLVVDGGDWSSALATVSLGKEHLEPMRYEAGWFQRQSVCCKKKNLIPLPQIKQQFLGHWVDSFVAVPTELFWLLQGQIFLSIIIFCFTYCLFRCHRHQLLHLHFDLHFVACLAVALSDPPIHVPHAHLTFSLYFCFPHHHLLFL